MKPYSKTNSTPYPRLFKTLVDITIGVIFAFIFAPLFAYAITIIGGSISFPELLILAAVISLGVSTFNQVYG